VLADVAARTVSAFGATVAISSGRSSTISVRCEALVVDAAGPSLTTIRAGAAAAIPKSINLKTPSASITFAGFTSQ
jgi:hypothetical protein